MPARPDLSRSWATCVVLWFSERHSGAPAAHPTLQTTIERWPAFDSCLPFDLACFISASNLHSKQGEVMSIKKFFMSHACFLLALVCLPVLTIPLVSQENTTSAQTSDRSTIEGTVASSTRQTFVVRTPDNQFQLFTFNRYTDKPQTLPVGTRIRVESRPSGDAGARLAIRVTTLEVAPKEKQRAAGTEAAPVPESVRNVESEIKRDTKRWRLGVQAGGAFDPELFMFGVHSQMGPIFSPRVFFRPSAEFAFGEVTDLIALNFEAVYRFRTAERRDWSPYFGAGPLLSTRTFRRAGT